LPAAADVSGLTSFNIGSPFGHCRLIFSVLAAGVLLVKLVPPAITSMPTSNDFQNWGLRLSHSAGGASHFPINA
jgi:hypothetical protein